MMKYALVDGQRREATPCLAGECPDCRSPMISKCGEVRVWHWAHRGGSDCDHWGEPETPWHRAWKDLFPAEWQEISHLADDGQIHRADVKTSSGIVLEFQRSHLEPEERRARDSFYPKLIWVVDGTRLKRSAPQLDSALKVGILMNKNPMVVKVLPDKSELLKEWGECRAPVFFDFGGVGAPAQSLLWCLLPKAPGQVTVLTAFPRSVLVELLRRGPDQSYGFSEFWGDVAKMVSRYAPLPHTALLPPPPAPPPVRPRTVQRPMYRGGWRSPRL